VPCIHVGTVLTLLHDPARIALAQLGHRSSRDDTRSDALRRAARCHNCCFGLAAA
jgi:hypothetical protein